MNKIIISECKLLQNVKSIKSSIVGQKLIAVIKANAYGHNAKIITRMLDKCVNAFAVSSVKEAEDINCLTQKDIMIISPVSKTDYLIASIKKFIIPIQSEYDFYCIKQFLSNTDMVLNVQIVLNTGMNRYGISDKLKLSKILNEASFIKNLRICGVYSHIASINKKRINIQKNKFNNLVKSCNLSNLKYVHFFASSSYKCISNVTNSVRIGFDLFDNHNDNIVMKVCGNITNILDVKSGEFIGYNNVYKVGKKTKIAVVSIGYADGFNRQNSNNGRVLIGGAFYNIVGNICMDCFMVDIGDDCKISVGDEVVVLGEQKNCLISATEIAKRTNTIEYEVYTNFNRGRFDYVIE